MSIVKKSLSKKILCLLLAAAMVLPGFAPAAATAYAAAGEETAGTVTATIEYIDEEGEVSYLMEPTSVEYKENMNALTALQEAYKDKGQVEYDSSWMEASVIPNGQDPIEYDFFGELAWEPFVNSTAYGMTKQVQPGDVIRLIYARENCSNIEEYSNRKLTVNKDELISVLGSMTDQQIQENKQLYDQAIEAALVNSEATQTEVNELTDQLNLIVAPDIGATGIEISPDALTIEAGETAQLSAKLTPEGATDKITWSSSDENIAYVDETGKVYGLSLGKVTVTAAVNDNVKDQITVTVTGTGATSVTLDKTEAEIEEGGSINLKTTVLPAGSQDIITYQSSSPEIASVDENGLVVGKLEGQAIITVKAGEAEAFCNVNVKARQKAEQPTVIFCHKDGRITELDKNTITLTPLDEGSFEIEGSDNISKVTWECSEKISEGGFNYNVIHINTGGGFNPVIGSRTAYAYVTDDKGNTSQISFTLTVVESDISQIQVFYGGLRLDQNTPVYIVGSDTKAITVKGRKDDSSPFVNIPVQALEGEATKGVYLGTDYGKGTFLIGADSSVQDNSSHTFTLRMKDNENVTASFTAVVKRVDVEKISVNIKDVYFIDAWNGLGDQYTGVTSTGLDKDYTYSIDVEPSNASDKRVTWVSHDPQIAEFQTTYGNGIVPKKAGTARFTVSSVDNSSASQDITVNFQYKYPLQSITFRQDEYELAQYSSVELDLEAAPSNATETRLVWSYSEDGIVSVTDIVMSSGNSDGKKSTTHTMTALKPGTVTVTGTPVDDTAGAEPVVFKVTVSEAEGKPVIDFDKYVTDNIEHSASYLKAALENNYYYEAEWAIFTVLRTGGTISQSDINAYCSSLLDELNSSSRIVPTDYFRIVMALCAMGKDPTDFEGINILERMYNYSRLDQYTSNMMSFTLMAYDSMDFEIPENALWQRDDLVNMILGFQNPENGGFGLADNKTVSVDITAMSLQALIPYNTEEYPEVQAAFEKGLDYLRGQMLGDCGFYVEGANNGCSVAQVLTLLCEAGIDPLDPDNGFVRGDATLVTKLNDFKLKNGFTTFEGSSSPDGMASYQIGCALESYRRFTAGETRLFDLRDVQRQDQEVIDQIAASEVEDLINAIGKVDGSSGPAIEKARRAYDLLTDEQKALVSNYDVLLMAEKQFALLTGNDKGDQNAAENEQESAQNSRLPKTSDQNDIAAAMSGTIISLGMILYLNKKRKEKAQ